jgi:hypothetical protein
MKWHRFMVFAVLFSKFSFSKFGGSVVAPLLKSPSPSPCGFHQRVLKESISISSMADLFELFLGTRVPWENGC